MDYKPPAGPPPGSMPSTTLASNNPYRDRQAGPEGGNTSKRYRSSADYSSSWSEKTAKYQPPPGPPPSHDGTDPPPYDPWLAIPDNALLPPPPALKNLFSFANNASSSDAERAERWCKQNGLWGPRTWTSAEIARIEGHQFSLSAPPGTKDMTISPAGPHRTSLKSSKRQADVTVLSNLPLLAPAQLPLRVGQVKSIYFEALIKHMSGHDASFAIGFVAPPFPPNRLPGWHRGSLAVHNDDGHRFVNDDEGGIDFVPPFGPGDRIGLGITYTGSAYEGQPAKAVVFFTRDGRRENGWDLHESRDVDALDGGVSGLDGTTDLYAAIGICGGVEVEIDWLA